MLTIVLGKTHLLSKIMLVLHHYIKHYAIVTLGLTRLVLFYNNFFFLLLIYQVFWLKKNCETCAEFRDLIIQIINLL
jgi:hypothetical protein